MNLQTQKRGICSIRRWKGERMEMSHHIATCTNIILRGLFYIATTRLLLLESRALWNVRREPAYI